MVGFLSKGWTKYCKPIMVKDIMAIIHTTAVVGHDGLNAYCQKSYSKSLLPLPKITN